MDISGRRVLHLIEPHLALGSLASGIWLSYSSLDTQIIILWIVAGLLGATFFITHYIFNNERIIIRPLLIEFCKNNGLSLKHYVQYRDYNEVPIEQVHATQFRGKSQHFYFYRIETDDQIGNPHKASVVIRNTLLPPMSAIESVRWLSSSDKELKENPADNKSYYRRNTLGFIFAVIVSVLAYFLTH